MEEFLSESEVAALHNRCGACNGTMEFDVQSGNLRCNHCRVVQALDNSGEVERRALTAEYLATRKQWTDGAVFRCNSCGAREVVEKSSLAKKCAFCGSSHIVSSEELAGIKPDSVIPFQISKDEAGNRFLKWIKGKIFAPKKVKEIRKDETFTSVYTTAWTFSANTLSHYNGTLGRRETRTRTVNGRQQTTTVTRYFRVNGQIPANYKDFFVKSGDAVNKKDFQRLGRFDLSLLKVYRQEFLAGIIAEHYTREIGECFNDFTNFAKQDIRRQILSRHSADTCRGLHINTNYSNKSFNNILLPVYIANYRYNKKNYNFLVNGASGKVVGKYPKSGWKIFFAIVFPPSMLVMMMS
jgi:hypothetical protein